MTNHTAPPHTLHRRTARRRTTQSWIGRLHPDRHLPVILGLNATTSLAAGLVAVTAAPWTATQLGLADTLWVRLVGGGLIAFALAVAGASRLRGPVLRRAATMISAADVSWVAASVAVTATGALSGRGVAIALAMAAGVGEFAALQLYLARRRDR